MTKTLHKHHIIPKHMGGSDDSSNLVELTIEEHAEAHRVLFEKYGRWEDELAWKGLSGMMSKEEIIRRQLSEAGKKSRRKLTTEDASNMAKICYEKNKEQTDAVLRANAQRAKGKKGKEYGGARRKWIWVNNGINNKKILAAGNIPDGYSKGRIMSWA